MVPAIFVCRFSMRKYLTLRQNRLANPQHQFFKHIHKNKNK